MVKNDKGWKDLKKKLVIKKFEPNYSKTIQQAQNVLNKFKIFGQSRFLDAILGSDKF